MLEFCLRGALSIFLFQHFLLKCKFEHLSHTFIAILCDYWLNTNTSRHVDVTVQSHGLLLPISQWNGCFHVDGKLFHNSKPRYNIFTSIFNLLFWKSVLLYDTRYIWSLWTPITMEIVGVAQMPTAFGMELLIGCAGISSRSYC